MPNVYGWIPIQVGRQREKRFGSNTETLLFTNTTDLPEVTNNTADRVQDIEDDVPFALGSPHPDTTGMSGSILKSKRLIAGPTNKRAIVALTWGPPNSFTGGTRNGLQYATSDYRDHYFYRSFLYYSDAISHKDQYRVVKDYNGPVRAQIVYTVTRSIGGEAGALAVQIAPNHGKAYTSIVTGIPLILMDSSVTQQDGSLARVSYRFWSLARVAPIAADPDRGLALAHPALDYLEKYIPQYELNATEVTRIGILTVSDQYASGAPLP